MHISATKYFLLLALILSFPAIYEIGAALSCRPVYNNSQPPKNNSSSALDLMGLRDIEQEQNFVASMATGDVELSIKKINLKFNKINLTK